ncbi:MAG TPA: GNAT family N-acetyltransferase [Solirubrobacteraceae bacterium]|nr:GNAT family N-acetyltransferase [Solirubrobacteraceae bacterium]
MLTVRRAEPEDAMDVAGVHVRAWQRAYRGLLDDRYLERLRPEDRAVRYSFEGRPDQPLTIVAEERGPVRGFVTISPSRTATGASTGELLALYVDPESWGQGIGRVLILEARRRMVERGHRAAEVWVLAGNERAERFYRADAWEAGKGRRRREAWGVLADELRYRRRLG